MPEPREARSIIEEAEQAAAAGNHSAAEGLLREAATLQEETLGPDHPDLANTLNNLGVVCEMTNNPIDAEHYFRRAYTIATATLATDHPFVATSRKNLHDFCAARGRPVELPPSSPEVAAWLNAPAPRTVAAREPSPSATQEVAPIPRKRFLRPLALGALSGAALLFAIFRMDRPWGSGAEEAKSPPATVRAAAQQTPVPELTLPPAEPIAPRQPAAMPTVVTAQLCTALRAWQCEAADSLVPPGPLFFYTQVKSATATTIEHRWYQGDRLRHAVQLRIQANPVAGYRTYSRNAITTERVGDWRVELRSADGAVLHEQRFTVR